MEDYLFEGNISVKAAVMGGMREVMEIIADENKRDKDTRWILHRAAERGIPIRRTSREEIDAAASGHTHGGLLARCGARRFQPLDDLAEKGRFLALIEGIEDPFWNDPAYAVCVRMRRGRPPAAQLDIRRGNRGPRKRWRQRASVDDHRGGHGDDDRRAERSRHRADLCRSQRCPLPI